MSDNVKTVTTSTSLDTGTGRLVGMVLSTSSGTVQFTFYDNTTGSGTKLLEIQVPNAQPVILFLAERFFINFSTGLYLSIGVGGSATVWWSAY
jgi:hypothetical protein